MLEPVYCVSNILSYMLMCQLFDFPLALLRCNSQTDVVHIWCTACCFNVHCELITVIKLINISITSYGFLLCVYVW